MASTLSEPAALVDAGPCGWCTHPQWSHKRGRGGCTDLECGGVCDRYTPPKNPPALAAGPTQTDPARQAYETFVESTSATFDVEAGLTAIVGPTDTAHPTLAEVEAEPDRPDEPQPVDEPVVADPAAQAEHAEQVAAIDAQLAEAGPGELLPGAVPVTEAEIQDLLVGRAEAAERERDRYRRERDGFEVQRDQAYERVDELNSDLRQVRAEFKRAEIGRQQVAQLLDETAAALADERAEHANTVGRLNTELDRVRAALLVAVDEDPVEAIERLHASLAGARERVGELERYVALLLDHANAVGVDPARVLWQYDADQCQTCGSRFTRWVDHEHPLIPVTVLVVDRRREVPGAA